MLNRRSFVSGLLVALAAPAIVRTPGLLMPVKPLVVPMPYEGYGGGFSILRNGTVNEALRPLPFSGSSPELTEWMRRLGVAINEMAGIPTSYHLPDAFIQQLA